VLRLMRSARESGAADLGSVAVMSMFGAVIAFFAGLLALKWLSRWLESGRWYLFGIYCLAASAAVIVLYRNGY
jgi:undecaprenyl-diphosphatase